MGNMHDAHRVSVPLFASLFRRSNPDPINKKAYQRPLAKALGFLATLKRQGGWEDDELWNLADMYAVGDDTNALVKVSVPSSRFSTFSSTALSRSRLFPRERHIVDVWFWKVCWSGGPNLSQKSRSVNAGPIL